MDPILGYLLDFNKTRQIEYSKRLVIPAGGLQHMLDNFEYYKLNRVEVIKDEIITVEEPAEDNTLEELYNLID